MTKTVKINKGSSKATTKNVSSPELALLPKAPLFSRSEVAADSKMRSKPIAYEQRTKLPSAFKLLIDSSKIIGENWKLLLGYALIYLIMNLILVQGLSSATNITQFKHKLELAPSHGIGRIGDGFTIYTYLLGQSGQSLNPFAGVYQLLLAIFIGIAVIWSLRQIYAGYSIRIRDGFYRGMFPLVQFFLVMSMVVLQLVPFVVGASIYSIVTANTLAANPFEQIGFLLLFLTGAFISLYMLSSSLIALYVVTLPDMTPMAALRTARDLVAHRRWEVMRKIIFLPTTIFILGTAILVPISLVLTGASPWFLAIIGALALILVHSYMFKLYRELL